jgi:hypothetical protein
MGLFSKKKNRKPFKETGFGKFATKVAGSLPELAGDILTIATSSNPIGASINIIKGKLLDAQDDANPQRSEEIDKLIAELEKSRMDWEAEIYALEIDDRKDSRKMYILKSEMADDIASAIITWNLPVIALLLVVEIFCAIYLKDDPTLLSVISLSIGAVSQALISERLTVIQFFYGSSLGSKKKQEKIEKER